jgi:hypothetical protein
MTRHWIVTDADGSNKRAVTLAGYAFAIETGAKPRVVGVLAKDMPISCDCCGDKTRAWDWSSNYDRFCLECLSGESDPRGDRADWEHDRTN